VISGELKPGDPVRVAASGQIAQVNRIVTFDGDRPLASAGDPVTLTLDREIDASRGDVLCTADAPVELSDHLEVTVVWMSQEALQTGRSYDLKLSTQWSTANITSIEHRIDVNTLSQQPATTLGMNDIAVCRLALGRPIAFDTFSSSRELGGFILVDRFSQATVAAGMVGRSLGRGQNVHRQSLSVDRAQRERLNGHRGCVVWLTGLSGAGKSTLADGLVRALHARGLHTYLLDGDNVRQGLNRDLGFTDADRVENIRRVAEVAKLMMDAGLIVLTAFISPFRREREMAREVIGDTSFFEIHVSTSLAVCEQRDPKGLYRKARAGNLPNMTGLDSPYEAPATPFLRLDLGDLDIDGGIACALDALMPKISG
jgi:bifunctional enzyme CysN/CysC